MDIMKPYAAQLLVPPMLWFVSGLVGESSTVTLHDRDLIGLVVDVTGF
jgi:hypothetical protein